MLIFFAFKLFKTCQTITGSELKAWKLEVGELLPPSGFFNNCLVYSDADHQLLNIQQPRGGGHIIIQLLKLVHMLQP